MSMVLMEGLKLNSSAAWGMVSKPTKSQGAMAVTAMTQARGVLPVAK